MPKFKLRAWATQTLYDCEDYEVEADTIEDAVKKLRAAQDRADDHSPSIMLCPDGITRITHGFDDDEMGAIDPEEVVDGEKGIAEFAVVNGFKIRELEGSPPLIDLPVADMLQLLRDLREWGERTGGWDAPVWDRLKAMLNQVDGVADEPIADETA